MKNNIAKTEKRIVKVSVDLVIPNPEQPRELFDDEKINNLARSIGARGMEQLPLLMLLGVVAPTAGNWSSFAV